MSTRRELVVAIPIYPLVDLLDVAAPRELFSWAATYSPDLALRVKVIAASRAPVRTRDGLRLVPEASFADCRRRKLRCDLLWVPGGDPKALRERMRDPVFLGFLRGQAEHASWVTSVCEGALLLAAAGLLDGYTATTHWAFVPCLGAYPQVAVAPGHPRFVVDRNRVTGGGISSGLDEALELIRLIAGNAVAEQVQQVTQYYPDPPVSSTIPPAGPCPLDEP